MRPHGRASVSSRNPRAFGICDRCGFLYNHDQLQWQFDWAGASLINTRVLVCRPCNDVQQPQLRAIILPADPVPIQNPRVQDYVAAETDNISLNAPTVTDFWTGIPVPNTTNIVTQNNQNVTTQVLGKPADLNQSAVMPLYNQSSFRINLQPLSVITNGTSTITVTCSSAHGLSTGSQISVEGLSNNSGDGIYSVTVTTATAFKYQVNKAIPAGSILQSTTLMLTAQVGTPYNYNQIPLTGV